MDILERLKLLPPDGEMPEVTDKTDYESNIMIIRCPDHLRSSPSDPEFHFAIVDRSIVGTNYSGNDILDKLCPGLPKVILPEDAKLKTNSPPPPPKKYTGIQKDFHFTRRGNRFNPGSRARSYCKKPRIERTDNPWIERNENPRIGRTDKSWAERNELRIERTDKSWMDRSMRSNVAEICPWVEGKQPWNNALGNIHVPLFDNVPMGIDYHEIGGSGRPVKDCFVPLKDTLPLPPDYPHTSGFFCGGPSPKYPTSKGLLGDHPYENDPGRSYRNHNPTGDPLNNTFPSVSRDPGIGNDYRNNNPRNTREGFQKNICFKRKPNGRLFQNDERIAEASNWNGNEGVRHNSRTRGPNRNRQRKSFNRGRQNFRARKKY